MADERHDTTETLSISISISIIIWFYCLKFKIVILEYYTAIVKQVNI